MINKNTGSEIEIQPEDLKCKTASDWILPWSQYEMAVLSTEISEWDCILRAVSSPFYNPL